jgi:hypothetical protein
MRRRSRRISESSGVVELKTVQLRGQGVYQSGIVPSKDSMTGQTCVVAYGRSHVCTRHVERHQSLLLTDTFAS